MKKWALMLASLLIATSLTGCYWRPGYYLNGGGYAPYNAQPAYPQQQPQYQMAPQQQYAPAQQQCCPPGYSPAPVCGCY